MKKWIALSLLLLLIPLSSLSSPTSKATAKVSLISSIKTLNQKNATFFIGVRVQLFNGWKIYWREPGVTGLPPKFNWRQLRNIKVIRVMWPYPSYKKVLDQTAIAYEKQVVFPVQVKARNPKKIAKVVLNLNYLLCRKDGCIPQEKTLQMTLRPGQGKASKSALLINQFLDKVPKTHHHPILKIQSVALKKNGISQLLITVSSLNSFKQPSLFIEGPSDIFFAKPKLTKKLADSHYQFTVDVFKDSSMKEPPTVSLINKKVTLTLVDDGQALEKTTKIKEYNRGLLTFIVILLVALLGGFILNFMPCVLPILFIKIMDIVDDSTEPLKKVRFDFLSTAIGILASFFALSLVAVTIKSFGTDFIWGSQFQQPIFITFMCIVLTIFACIFFGLFEITFFSAATSAAAQASSTNRFLEHFLRGAFTTLLATPCSAPFVGTALSFALSRGPFEIILIFLAMGLGFSILYLLIAAFPRFKNIIPKPGAWMQILRIILGFALVGTVLWLLYVLSIQLPALTIGLVTLLLIGVSITLLIKHKIPTFSKLATYLIIIGFSLTAMALPNFSLFSHTTTPAHAPTGFWKPFNTSKIPQYIKQNKIIFVDVTAKWCSTCYYNKKFVLETTVVTKALTQPNVIAMRADWTNRSNRITRYLNSFNRHAIPFNVIYSKKYPQGLVLPELLTTNAVLKSLEQANPKSQK